MLLVHSIYLTWNTTMNAAEPNRGKGAQLAASLRFRVDIDDVPRYFRLLLLPPGVSMADRAQAALPQVHCHYICWSVKF